MNVLHPLHAPGVRSLRGHLSSLPLFGFMEYALLGLIVRWERISFAIVDASFPNVFAISLFLASFSIPV